MVFGEVVGHGEVVDPGAVVGDGGDAVDDHPRELVCSCR